MKLFTGAGPGVMLILEIPGVYPGVLALDAIWRIADASLPPLPLITANRSNHRLSQSRLAIVPDRCANAGLSAVGLPFR